MITIIPALDIIGGKCVRLSQGDFNRKTSYLIDPLEMAQRFEDAGLQRLHLVDLDGAKTGQVVNLAVLDKIAKYTNLKVDFSGGIKTKEEIQTILSAGAAWVSIGSMAVKDPETFTAWLDHFGPEKIMLGADVKQEQVVIQGWQQQTDLNVLNFIQPYYKLGLRQVFCTDIMLDGMLQGPSVSLYKKMLEHFPGLFLIASGGVTTLDDIDRLEEAGCKGVIVGKAIYEGRISLEALVQRTLKNN